MRRLLTALSLVTTFACGRGQLPSVREGDIIFQTSLSAQSSAIQKATDSIYSHMGIILMKDGKPCVFEAVSKVRYTPLEKWIKRGKGRLFVVKRLLNASSILTAANLAHLHEATKDFEGKPYDLTFEWSDQRIYCSELVWKIYQKAVGVEIGNLQRLRDFRLDNPIVQQKLTERYGNRIPMDEPVISPVAMFNSRLLQTVAQE